MVSVPLASRYVTSASRYQSRTSMYIRGLIPRNFTELSEAVPINSLSASPFCCKVDPDMAQIKGQARLRKS